MTEENAVCWCDLCGTELYRGEFCYRIEGRRICPDCLGEYARRRFCALLELVQ